MIRSGSKPLSTVLYPKSWRFAARTYAALSRGDSGTTAEPLHLPAAGGKMHADYCNAVRNPPWSRIETSGIAPIPEVRSVTLFRRRIGTHPHPSDSTWFFGECEGLVLAQAQKRTRAEHRYLAHERLATACRKIVGAVHRLAPGSVPCDGYRPVFPLPNVCPWRCRHPCRLC